MEIINAHVHLVEFERMLQEQGDVRIPAGVSVLRDLEKTLPLLDPAELLRQMDEAGVARSVLFAVDGPVLYSSNAYVAGLCQRHPQRFIGFASVNPVLPDAAERLDHAIRHLGLKGLKLHPPLQGFHPLDERAFPVYRKAQELGIPVVFHVGTTPFGCLCRLEQADPIHVDEIAVRFPDLKLVLTHLGTLSHHQAFMVVEKNPNVYIDTSAYLYEISQLLTVDLIERVGPDKFIFGTDYPMPFAGKVHRIGDFVECIRSLPIPIEYQERIFSLNFLEMMKIKEPAPAIGLKDLIARMAAQGGPSPA